MKRTTPKRRSIEILEQYQSRMIKHYENMKEDASGKYYKYSEKNMIFDEIIILELDIKSLRNISYAEQTKFL